MVLFIEDDEVFSKCKEKCPGEINAVDRVAECEHNCVRVLYRELSYRRNKH